MSNCTDRGLNPPQNACNASGNWDFSYYVCQVRADPGTGGCSFQTQANNYVCSAADACEGGSGGGTGYATNGHVIAGHCSPGSYVEGDPGSACTSYGYYKQCCSPDGVNPATYCSNGTCPIGEITSPGVTTCGSALPTSTPTPCTNTCSTATSPGSNCSYNSGGDAWCQNQPNGAQDKYCWNCSGATPTPTPTGPAATSSPTPTSASCGGGQTYCAGWGCIPSCAQCNGGWPPYYPPSCAGGGGGGCEGIGATCGYGTTTACCSGLLCHTDTPSAYSQGSCDIPPSCSSSCLSFMPSTWGCVDNCSSGYYCSDTGGGTCVAEQYTISGGFFVDTDEDGNQDYARYCQDDNSNGVCDTPYRSCFGGWRCLLESPGEQAYAGSGGSGILSLGNTTMNATAGEFAFTGLNMGTYSLTGVAPTGYEITSTNPRTVTIGPDYYVAYGLKAAALPACVPGSISLNPSGGTADPGTSKTLSVTSCTNVENPNDGSPPPPFSWNPDTNGNSPAPTTSGQTDTPTSSTVTWTAPNCPTSTNIYAPRVTVGGSGGTVNYTTSITVPATVSVAAHVRDVTSSGGCTSSSGNPYNNGGTGANLNLTNGGTVKQNQITNGGTGQASFTCLPQGNYTITLAVPSGYSVIGTDVSPAVESPAGSNGLSFATSSNNQTAVFCIAPIDPWFQTDFGDVRLLNLLNPVPSGLKGSTGGTDGYFPGIFFSSDSATRAFGNGSASTKGWFINGEYSYNADTENRNGGMSYDFYKSKANRDGVTITEIPEEDPIDLSDETQFPDVEGRIYEVGGAGSITSIGSSPITITGKRIVILAKGDVRIDQPIRVTAGNGLLIIAAKGDITIGEEVGTATLTSTATQLDGYFTAQGSIIIESKTPNITDQCTASAVDDLRLNVGGALVANSLKPFSSTGTGSIQNNRNLCLNNLLYPSLYISSRPDFLTQLTDFYKISYTKWSEVNP